MMKHADDKKIEKLRKDFHEFTKVVLHDLSAPVRIMQGYTDFLMEDLEDGLTEKQAGYIKSVRLARDQFSEIAQELNRYSRLISNYSEQEEPFDTSDIIDQVILKFSEKIKKDNIALTKEGEFPKIKGDPNQFYQLLWELVDNAIKFKSEKHDLKIQISVSDDGGEYEFSVKDNGIGMHERCFDRIFLVLRKMHSDEEYLGAGMGLANAKIIAENFGGRVGVKSIESEGSIFSFYIPKR